MMLFSDLGLPDTLLRALDKAGYTVPTPVQQESIPLVLQGKDLIIEAQTGTGKTAAFALPVLKLLEDALSKNSKTGIFTLVIVPTRELCVQVSAFFRKYGLYLKDQIKVLSIIGGEDIEAQIKNLKNHTGIVVATPGRLIDLLSKKTLTLASLKIFVIDEADKILNMGFADELNTIINMLPADRQNLLVSATYPEKVVSLTEKIMKAPLHVRFEADLPTVENITQRAILVNREERGLLLRHLIKNEKWDLVLVFVASKTGARNLTQKLNKNGIKALEFHADLSQSERTGALAGFRSRAVTVLVATDLAARGLDISLVSHVVNFDLPRSPEDYIHRIGRTARAGEKGHAVTFLNSENIDHFRLIEKRARIQLEREQIEGFPFTEEMVVKKGKAPVKGKRKSKKDKLREMQQKDQ